MTDDQKNPPEFESKLLPILREAVEVVKMIFFSRLKAYLAGHYPTLEPAVVGKLAGAVVNELFGTPNPDPAFVAFRAAHAERVAEILPTLGHALPELRIPLSDALRISVLCDHQESGLDSSAILVRAKELGLLILDRDLPLPHRFLELVRRLGKAYGLILPPAIRDDA